MTAVTEELGKCYLREQTKIEPLVYRWYAWSHLISPIQQALHLAYRYVPALKSFLANPNVHVAALRDSRMFTGPYLQLDKKYAALAQDLLQDILHRGSSVLRVADEIIGFDRQLQSYAKGSTLDPIYGMVPEFFKGVLELTYSLNNKPSLRLFESMLDDFSTPYADACQIGFNDILDEERGYFLNAPRLDSRCFVVNIPFNHSVFNNISAARIRPISFPDVADELALSPADRQRLGTFFTTTPPLRKDVSYEGASIRVRYFGHACVLIETADASILIDPLVSWDLRTGNDGHLTFYDLPEHIDYVFISHSHQDHFYPEVFLQLRERIGKILVPRNNPSSLADPSIKYALSRLGHHAVEIIEPLEAVNIPDGRITSIPFYGEHADLDVQSKHGLHLELKNHKFMFVVDSDCKEPRLYRRLASRLGKIDTLFIGMECEGAPLTWLYHPYLSAPIARKDDESRRLSGSNCEKAWNVVQECGCQEVFVYAMGQESWLKYMIGLQYGPDSKQIRESDLLIERCHKQGLKAERLYGCQTLTY